MGDMDSSKCLNAGIGITYGLRQLRLAIDILSVGVPGLQDPKLLKRMDDIEEVLRDHQVAHRLYEGAIITGSILTFIDEVDGVVKNFPYNYKRDNYTWVNTTCSKVLDHMELELRGLGMLPPADPIPRREGKAHWLWDESRKAYYYWSAMDHFFKYQTGLWVRLDGSTSSEAQETAVKRAAANAALIGPSPPLALGYISEKSGLSTPMRQLTMGNGEDGQLDQSHSEYSERFVSKKRKEYHSKGGFS